MLMCGCGDKWTAVSSVSVPKLNIKLQYNNKAIKGRGIISTTRDAVRKALHDFGRMWYKKRLPRHFEESAHSEYGLTKRGAKYNKWKERTKHHTKPLIGPNTKKKYGGNLRRMALSSGEIRATNKKLRVKFRAPSYVNGRKDGSSRDLKQELIALSDNEQRVLARFVKERIAEAIKSKKGDRTLKF